MNCVSSVYGIYVSGQLSRDVIGCFKSNRWLSRDVIGCWFVKSCCYWLTDRREFGLSVCQVLFCLSLISRLYSAGNCWHRLSGVRSKLVNQLSRVSRW